MAKMLSLDELKAQLKSNYEKSGKILQSDLDTMFDKYDLNDESVEELQEYIQDNKFTIVEEDDNDGDIDETQLNASDDVDDLDDVFEEEEEEDDNSYESDIDALERSFAANQQTRLNDPVKMYLKEIGQVELLSADEEVEIATKIDAGTKAKEEFEQVREVVEISKDSVVEILTEELGTTPTEDQINIRLKMMIPDQMARYDELKTIIEEGDEAKKKLIASNLRLVVSIAKKYVGRGMLFLDLIQEGNMGLAKAVEKFDYTKGFKFSTYATWWIRQAITRAIADQARTIRIPVHMVETINKLTRIQRQLVQDIGREPTAEEIAEKMENITPEKVREIQKIALEPVSLETPIGEEDDSHLGDFIEDKDAMSPDEYANNQLLKDEINNVLQGLTEREEKVLRLRFGLYDGKTRTLEEVGKEFNVTRERIRQIEAKALRKLKHPTRSKRLKDFVDHS